MIENVRKFREDTRDPEINDLYDVDYADVFYWDEMELVLVGTWVRHSGQDIWHSGGWKNRPSQSKEKAMRFLHELARPA